MGQKFFLSLPLSFWRNPKKFGQHIWTFFFWKIPFFDHPSNEYFLWIFFFEKKSLNFLKFPPALHTHRVSPLHYNRNRFHEKNIDEINILQRNLARFSCFFPNSPYVSRILFCKKVWKTIWNTFANFFFDFLKITIYNTHFEKISIYSCNFKIYVIFKVHEKCTFLK